MLTPIQRRSQASQKAARTRALMAAANNRTPKCSSCGGERDTTGRYCRMCRRRYDRSRRLAQPSRDTAGVTAGILSQSV